MTNCVTVEAAGNRYDIFVEDGVISRAHAYLSGFAGRKAAVVTDTNVYALYGAALSESLTKIGIQADIIAIDPGETSKSHEKLLYLYSRFLDAGITRSDCIIALGGGVVGDLTGYAGATFLRGVDVIQIPTTLLAQVDSSVGGKVAVNLPQGKNLVGVFAQPKLVLCDTGALNTLDPREMGAGLGEVVKYGCIFDEGLFVRLEEAGSRAALKSFMPEIVRKCCAIKADYVHRDPFDNGARKELNFGHTLGHALEQTLGYGILLHGEAVCVGMVQAARWGERLGVSPFGTADRIERLLNKLELPIKAPSVDMKPVYEAMLVDKKGRGDMIDLVLLNEIGNACLKRMPKRELLTLMCGGES
ncbi:MAG: 3-dehydroquinate synthase [Bacillota bacterium]